MNKNLSIVSQNNQLMLKKSKSLIAVTNNILSNDDWIQPLWDWADTYDISIYAIPREKYKLKNCRSLTLWDYNLNMIPKEIGNLTTVTMLNLEYNKLTEIPIEVYNLVNLRGLGLFQNKIEYLPDSIDNLVNLSYLNLASNKLQELPTNIIKMIDLTELTLNKNPDLILSKYQKAWILELIENGCKISMDDDLLERQSDYEIVRGK